MQPKLLESAVVQSVGDELLVLDRSTDRLHHLNQTAAWILSHCDGQTSTDVIVDRLTDEFAVEHAVAARDVQAVLEQLGSLGVIGDS